MLDFVDKTLHQVPLTIPPSIVVAQDLGTLVRWNHDFNASRQQVFEKMLCRIASVCDQVIEVKPLKQRVSVGDVVAVSTAQNKTQRITQPIDRDVDFATEASTTAPQRLFTVFFRHRLHRDVPAQSCCLSSHFPDRDRQQSKPTSVPIPRWYTSGQSVYTHYSSCHIQRAASAIVRHYARSTSRLQRNDGTLPRFPHRHSGLVTKSPEFLSIHVRLGLHLSSAYFTHLTQMSTQPRNVICFSSPAAHGQ